MFGPLSYLHRLMQNPTPSDTPADLALLAQLDGWMKQGLLNAAIDEWLGLSESAPHMRDHLGRIAHLLVRRGMEIYYAGNGAEALPYFHMAMKARPDWLPALNNAANILHGLGRLDESTALYERALALDPAFTPAASGLLMNMHYTVDTSARKLGDAHRQWGKTFVSTPLSPQRNLANENPDRPLRIGFVSSDFGNHPVGYFLIRYLENIDHQNFIIYAYAGNQRSGKLGDRFQKSFDHFCLTENLDDDALAKKIQADAIDILIDLSGHTAGHRLGVFARKPAPIQISWLGYPWENGLPTMDYLIGDPLILPMALQPHLQARIAHLPDCFVCFDPPPEAAAITPLPALSGAPFTFGYFGSPSKCNDAVITLWAKILQQVPQARLLFKYSGFNDHECQAHFISKFAQHNITPQQLVFQDRSDLPEMFTMMQSVDLALDTFPFSGGLMSAMMLGMGIPIVTLPGECFSSRQGLSFQTAIGVTDAIATNADDYVAKAVALATDLQHLNHLRQKLRPTMNTSIFCDGPKAARNLEHLLRQVWRQSI